MLQRSQKDRGEQPRVGENGRNRLNDVALIPQGTMQGGGRNNICWVQIRKAPKQWIRHRGGNRSIILMEQLSRNDNIDTFCTNKTDSWDELCRH